MALQQAAPLSSTSQLEPLRSTSQLEPLRSTSQLQALTVPGVASMPDGHLPIRMLHDRVLVSTEGEAGERRSSAGIVIPATAQMGKRLAWAQVVAIGASVRTVERGDRVLFDPEDRAEVEVRGRDYVLLRERDIHAVAAERLADGGQTGLYL